MKRTPLIPRPPIDRTGEPGYRAWHAPLYGCCAVCSKPGPLERHHVISEQHVRREGGDPWDLADSIELGRHCRCHRDHTHAVRRLPASKLTAGHLGFAVALLGEDRAADYIARYYRAA